MLVAVGERLGPNPQELVTDHRAALDALQSILSGKTEVPATMSAPFKGSSVEMTGLFATGSTFSENLLPEYANGFVSAALRWAA
jgi:hypothetical protein